jgi:hypothetical protein
MRSIEEIRVFDIDCLRVREDDIEYVVTRSMGPRILQFGFAGEEGVFGAHPTAQVETPHGVWRPVGGHRLWVAPEAKNVSYAPDNEEVEIEEDDDTLELCQSVDQALLQKQMTIRVESGSLIVEHQITNHASEPSTVALWPLTIMRPGGTAILPQEPFQSHADSLLPVRTISLWSYTDFSDERWKFTSSSIQLHVDESKTTPQKIGAANRRGWLAYTLPEWSFVKSFSFVEHASYPDMGSNCEIYTAGSFVELESLGPLTQLRCGEYLTHREVWQVVRTLENEDELQSLHERHRSLLDKSILSPPLI